IKIFTAFINMPKSKLELSKHNNFTIGAANRIIPLARFIPLVQCELYDKFYSGMQDLNITDNYDNAISAMRALATLPDKTLFDAIANSWLKNIRNHDFRVCRALFAIRKQLSKPQVDNLLTFLLEKNYNVHYFSMLVDLIPHVSKLTE